MSDFYATIGANIRAHRKARGLSQEQLAEAIKQTRTSLVNMEQGRQRMPLHTLALIAETIGVSVGALLPGEWFEGYAARTIAALQAHIKVLEANAARVAELAEWLYQETR